MLGAPPPLAVAPSPGRSRSTKPRGLHVATTLGAALWTSALAPACASETPAIVESPSAQPHVTPNAPETPAAPHVANAVDVTILSTSKPGIGEGEWGFSALVEVNGQRILFDTGAKPETVLRNASTAGIDLGDISTVVLSHHHDDHVGGLLRLRDAVANSAPAALSTVHVARGMFESRHIDGKHREVNAMVKIREAFEASGGSFVIHDKPTEIGPGVWVTGPVPRVHSERNWGGRRQVPEPKLGWAPDQLHESQALVIDTREGLLVISGCGHAGIVNIATHAQQTIRNAPVHALGGFHLHRASATHLSWTMDQLDALGLAGFYGAHCTGSAAVLEASKHLPANQVAEVAVGWTLHL